MTFGTTQIFKFLTTEQNVKVNNNAFGLFVLCACLLPRIYLCNLAISDILTKCTRDSR